MPDVAFGCPRLETNPTQTPARIGILCIPITKLPALPMFPGVLMNWEVVIASKRESMQLRRKQKKFIYTSNVKEI